MDTDDIAFDALATGRELRAAGVEDRQTEAIAAGMRRAAIAGREGLATKADLDVLRAHIDARFAVFEARVSRALWVQGWSVIFIMAGLMSIAALLGMFR